MAISKTLALALVLSARTNQASVAIDRFTSKTAKKLDELSRKSSDFIKSGVVDIGVGTAAARPFVSLIEQAAKFEDGMIAVRKQMQNDTPRAVADMTGNIFKMSKVLGMASSDVQDLVANGLKMGVAEKSIEKFTLTAGKMASAFEMPASEISEKMAGIANMFKLPIDRISDLGDAINYLDDNTLSSGANLIDLMQRIGGISKYLSYQQAAAISSTMLTLGETPERAATAINGMINTLAAAGVQSKRSQMMMRAIGFDPNDLQKRMVTDAEGVIRSVIDRISKLKPEKQQSALYTIFGGERVPALNKLINGLPEYQKQKGMLNGSQSGSMNKEFLKKQGTYSYHLQNAKTSLTELSVSMGNALLPAATEVMQKLTPLVEKFGEWAKDNPGTIKTIAKMVMAFAGMKIVSGGLKIAFGGFLSPLKNVIGFFAKGENGVSKFTKTLSFLSEAKKRLGSGLFNARFFGEIYVRKAIKWFGSFSKVLSGGLVKAFSTVGRAAMMAGRFLMANPIILAVTLIAGLVYLIIRNWDKIKPWIQKLWAWVTNVTKKAWNVLKGFFSVLWNNVKSIFNKALDIGKFLFLNFTPMGLVIKYWEPLTNFFSNLWEGIKNAFWKAIDWIVKKFKWFNDVVLKPLKIGVNFAANAMGGPSPVSASPAPAPLPYRATSNNTVTFNPVINLNGAADPASVQLVSAQIRRDFDKRMQEYEYNKQRRAIS